jgi:hypothetical protein
MILCLAVATACTEPDGRSAADGTSAVPATGTSYVSANAPEGGPRIRTGAEVYRYRSNGSFAALWAHAETTPTSLALSVSDSGDPNDPIAYLWFELDDWAAGTALIGSGEIPAGDFNGTRLSTNTVGNPGFQVMSCRFVDSEWVCEPAEGGVIEFTWQKNGYMSSRSHGQSSWTFGTMTMRSNGWSEWRSASATGTILGSSWTTQDGQIGRNHDQTMEIVRPSR